MKSKLLFLCFLFAGCAVQQGNFTCNTSLQPASYKVMGRAEGQASVSYILGIGGFRSTGLNNQAKQNLYSNAKLTSNQALANVTADNKQLIIFPFYYKHTLILTADIVEPAINAEPDVFGGSVIYRAPENADSTQRKPKVSVPVNNSAGFQVGDRIKIPRGLRTIEGIIVQIKTRSVVAQYQQNGKTKTVELDNYFVEKL